MALLQALACTAQLARQDAPHSNATAQATGNQQDTPGEPSAALQNQPASTSTNGDANNHQSAQNQKLSRWGAVEWSAVAQAVSAVLVAVFTGFLVWYSHHGWTVAKKSAEASQMSAEAAILAVEHADRPWIRVYLLAEKVTISETEGIEIKCRVTAKNIGKSVAQQVIIWDHLAVETREVLAAEQEKLRANFDDPRMSNSFGGQTIFPGDEYIESHTIGTGNEAPEKFWREHMPHMLEKELGDRMLVLTYIGCVGYRYGTSNKWHFTYWAYELLSADGRHLALQIATGQLPQPPHLRQPYFGNLNRAN